MSAVPVGVGCIWFSSLWFISWTTKDAFLEAYWPSVHLWWNVCPDLLSILLLGFVFFFNHQAVGVLYKSWTPVLSQTRVSGIVRTGSYSKKHV